MSFESMEYSAPAQTGSINLVLKDDQKVTWISDYIRKGSQPTELRMLPAIGADGEALATLDPNFTGGNGDKYAAVAALGRAFCAVPVLQLYRSGTHFIPDMVAEYDESGNPSPPGQSPARIFASRVADKIREQNLLEKRNLQAPQKAWSNYTVNYIRTRYLVQALLVGEDGKPCLDMATGAPRPKCPAVFAIPHGHWTKFSQDITSRKDFNAPLSESNNQLGDFISPDGHNLILKRYDPVQRGPVTYALNLGRHNPIPIEFLRKVVRPWSEVLHKPTVEEVIRALESLFEAEIIDYAFRGSAYESYISEHVKGTSSRIQDAIRIVQDEFETPHYAQPVHTASQQQQPQQNWQQPQQPQQNWQQQQQPQQPQQNWQQQQQTSQRAQGGPARVASDVPFDLDGEQSLADKGLAPATGAAQANLPSGDSDASTYASMLKDMTQ